MGLSVAVNAKENDPLADTAVLSNRHCVLVKSGDAAIPGFVVALTPQPFAAMGPFPTGRVVPVVTGSGAEELKFVAKAGATRGAIPYDLP